MNFLQPRRSQTQTHKNIRVAFSGWMGENNCLCRDLESLVEGHNK